MSINLEMIMSGKKDSSKPSIEFIMGDYSNRKAKSLISLIPKDTEILEQSFSEKKLQAIPMMLKLTYHPQSSKEALNNID
jgi:hypothetical protein